jgi:CheY-like chemotaxis protein
MSEPRRKRPVSALLVDDDPSSRTATMERLQREGYEVTLCADPAAALSLAQRSLPGIIFVHIGRRGSGSLPFLDGLRADDQTRHVPVVILSNNRARSITRLGLSVVDQGQW